MKYRVVPIEEAVGMVLPHDVTEIIPGEFKGARFKKGHIIKEEDVPKLKDLGKNHIYVLELEEEDIHEDEAALRMARAVAGEGVGWSESVSEGKITFKALYEGLLKVDIERLLEINLLGEVALTTKHNNVWVKKGEPLAGVRAIPLVVKEALLREVERIAQSSDKKILRVLPQKIFKAGLLITGTEVFYGRIKDAFAPKMLPKLSAFNLSVEGPLYAPDEKDFIRDTIRDFLDRGCEVVLVTGGMSVDPDDVTKVAIRELNPEVYVYGAPVLPGNMFLYALLGDNRVILGIPACAMYFKVTILDIILPRVLVGEKLDRRAIASLGHGGFCYNCKECHYPICPFGKAS
ncbi:MAG: molybdopterin-binding protein [Caldimicrobium sp.]|nr:molybdopterin-binding protein [Caldimicrobium sp.]